MPSPQVLGFTFSWCQVESIYTGCLSLQIQNVGKLAVEVLRAQADGSSPAGIASSLCSSQCSLGLPVLYLAAQAWVTLGCQANIIFVMSLFFQKLSSDIVNPVFAQQ